MGRKVDEIMPNGYIDYIDIGNRLLYGNRIITKVECNSFTFDNLQIRLENMGERRSLPGITGFFLYGAEIVIPDNVSDMGNGEFYIYRKYENRNDLVRSRVSTCEELICILKENGLQNGNIKMTDKEVEDWEERWMS
jgi:hypothetical protein